MNRRIHLFITGKVQGVWFRESTKLEAQEQGVFGWVRNLPDGRVEAVIEGEQAPVERMLAWCHVGPSAAQVQHVDAAPETPTGEFDAFRVIR